MNIITKLEKFQKIINLDIIDEVVAKTNLFLQKKSFFPGTRSKPYQSGKSFVLSKPITVNWFQEA